MVWRVVQSSFGYVWLVAPSSILRVVHPLTRLCGRFESCVIDSAFAIPCVCCGRSMLSISFLSPFPPRIPCFAPCMFWFSPCPVSLLLPLLSHAVFADQQFSFLRFRPRVDNHKLNFSGMLHVCEIFATNQVHPLHTYITPHVNTDCNSIHRKCH